MRIQSAQWVARSWMPTAKLVFAGLALLFVATTTVRLYREQYTVVLPETITDNLDQNDELRPLIKFASACRALKLITVTVDSTVTAESENENWRGTAKASMTVPVRYGYGVDLSKMRNSGFLLKPYKKQYSMLVPRPMRITTEVDTRNVNSKVDVWASPRTVGAP